MERLDAAVKQALKDRLFAPERLALLLRSLAEQHSRQSAEVSDRIMALHWKFDDTEERIKRLYDAIATKSSKSMTHFVTESNAFASIGTRRVEAWRERRPRWARQS